MGLGILLLCKVVSYKIHVERMRKNIAGEHIYASCRRQQGVGSLQTIMTGSWNGLDTRKRVLEWPDGQMEQVMPHREGQSEGSDCLPEGQGETMGRF